jgi:hypothetical protein
VRPRMTLPDCAAVLEDLLHEARESGIDVEAMVGDWLTREQHRREVEHDREIDRKLEKLVRTAQGRVLIYVEQLVHIMGRLQAIGAPRIGQHLYQVGASLTIRVVPQSMGSWWVMGEVVDLAIMLSGDLTTGARRDVDIMLLRARSQGRLGAFEDWRDPKRKWKPRPMGINYYPPPTPTPWQRHEAWPDCPVCGGAMSIHESDLGEAFCPVVQVGRETRGCGWRGRLPDPPVSPPGVPPDE